MKTEEFDTKTIAELVAEDHFVTYGQKKLEIVDQFEPEVVMTMKDFVSKYASSVELQASSDYPTSFNEDGIISDRQKKVQRIMFDKLGALQFITETANIEDDMEYMELCGILTEIIMSPFRVFTLDYILSQLENFDLK